METSISKTQPQLPAQQVTCITTVRPEWWVYTCIMYRTSCAPMHLNHTWHNTQVLYYYTCVNLRHGSIYTHDTSVDVTNFDMVVQDLASALMYKWVILRQWGCTLFSWCLWLVSIIFPICHNLAWIIATTSVIMLVWWTFIMGSIDSATRLCIAFS